MKELQFSAYAKINLTLDVLGKRADGYHEVEMIMQSIDLHDQISLQEQKSGIDILVNHPLVPNDEDNLAYRAASLLMETSQVNSGVRIEIAKNIPVAAGLAGGSSDAAAVLVGLNQLWNLGLSKQELMELGSQLGADVPFCILGGTVLAKGIGTELIPVESLPEIDLVLVKPEISISTKDIYSRYSPALVKRKPELKAMLTGIRERNIQTIKANLVNVLEDITLHYYPEVQRIKDQMLEMGLSSVLMSGSGPTLFALVDSSEIAEKCVNQLKSVINGQVIGTRTGKGN